MSLVTKQALITKFEPYKAWSLLSDAPTILYLEHHDEYYVMWGGLIMPYQMAMLMLGQFVLHTYVSNTMLENAYEKTKFMIREMFDGPNYFEGGRHYLKYVYNKIGVSTIEPFVKNHSADEAVTYFDLSQANGI